MQVKAESLVGSLKRELKSIYLVSGDELLLVQESCDAIVKSAKEQGFAERAVYQLGVDGSWDDLREESNSLS